MELPKKYNYKEAEPRIQQFWNQKKIFEYKESDHKPIYSIDTPPPTVSAFHLHVGHGMSYSQAEFVARYKRMRGFNVFYPMGFDDNGLPTERYVEKRKKVSATKMPREEFVKLCLEETKIAGQNYKEMWDKLGLSIDWNLLYSTIDPKTQKISQKSFLDLHKKGYVSQVDSPTTWCMQCQTAIAQAEFENVEVSSHFNDVIFKSHGKELVIATTRPELIPACVALFAHPSDERYQELKGKHATVPIFEYEVPILFDEAVDKEKGTGLMMVCTFGDKEDIEKWHKHKLPLRVIFTKYGKLNELAGKYEGLKIKDARKAIREDLKEKGLLIRDREINHAVNVHERCGTELEFLKTKQWFINVIDHKEELLKVGDKIKWYPEHMKTRYKHWVEGLNWNWCISRQRYYGVPFPAWYSKKTGEVILADESELPIDPMLQLPKYLPEGHGPEDIEPEKDVMDTWATSSVTPQINSKWGEENERHEIMPMSLRPQAHDIIRTWAFYTIVKSYYHNKEIPWEDIMISGHGQDPQGKKMSKSKNNFIAITDITNKYGADAFRFWCASAKLGEDLPFQEKEVLSGSKTINKLWNASKFVLMHLGEKEKEAKRTLVDKWLLSKLQKIIKKSTESFDKYDYSRTKAEAENFFWNTYCDQYLELVKDKLYKPENYSSGNTGAKDTLHYSLDVILKLFAPIMPHVTEEIWQAHYKQYEEKESIHQSKWPDFTENLVDEEAEKIIDQLIPLIAKVRQYKNEKQLSLNAELEEITIKGNKTLIEKLKEVEEDIKGVTKAKKISWEETEETTISIKS